MEITAYTSSQYGREKTESYAATSTQKTGTNTYADWKSVNQTGPTDNLLSSSGVVGIAFSSNTERSRSKRGRERENRTKM